ncbi:MAG: iron(III) transport system ATP-binding protein [Alphaproteobacteria bacterium]|jgi:ABC-type sulfate/molybdate transport systems ATPase subunit|nr:iron(III) transport system ATP-binding protein [Alphaproteobacteria bacterium]
MTAPLLSVSALTVTIGGKSILSDVTLGVARGAVLGLFGDSGSGKTTLLHAICGLDAPGAAVCGQIQFDGHSLIGMPPDVRSRLGIGVVLQTLGLFEDRTVFENVIYGLRRRAVCSREARARVEETLVFLRLSEFAYRRPGSLSGGQRQRVALARAIVYRPLLLLLDEPLRGLEEELRLEFLAFIRAIGRQGTTIVFVTHDGLELQLTADHVITLASGRLVGQESRRAERPFTSLEGQYRIRGSDGGTGEVLCGLRLADASAFEDVLEVEAHEWRPLGGRRAAALVSRPGGPPAWLLFDDLPQGTLPTGVIAIAGKRKG